MSSPRYADVRGAFTELLDLEALAEATGEPPLRPVRWCVSESRRDVVRGLHASRSGRRKAITCLRGEVQYVAVDVRPESRTYLRWAWTDLSAGWTAVAGAGVAHGFCALSDATIGYLLEGPHDPDDELTINPLDPRIGVVWAVDRPTLSKRDASAPFLV